MAYIRRNALRLLRPTDAGTCDIAMPQQRPDPTPIAMALQQIDGEKVRASGMPGTATVGHLSSIAAVYIRRNALRLLRPTRAKGHVRKAQESRVD